MVAPFAGAWIETYVNTEDLFAYPVAPFAGAWIETTVTISNMEDKWRRALRGRVD